MIFQETLKIYKIYDKINKKKKEIYIGFLSKLYLKYNRSIKDLRQKNDKIYTFQRLYHQAQISTYLDIKIMLKRVDENEKLSNKSCLKRGKNENESEGDNSCLKRKNKRVGNM